MDKEGRQRVTIHVWQNSGLPHIIRGTLKRRTGKLQEVGSITFATRISPKMNPMD